MFGGHRRGAILSLAAHAICACHFSLTTRCQNKGPGGCCRFSFPQHTGNSRFGETLALALSHHQQLILSLLQPL